MHPELREFQLPFFSAEHKIVSLLKKFAKKQKPSQLPKVSLALLKKIEIYKKNLQDFGLPPNLILAQVNPQIRWGIFLKADAKPIKKGTFIGIYAGKLEIVYASETENNHYAYDLAPNIKIKKEHAALVRSKQKPVDLKEDFSIQVNAEEMGNYTRYINHSSLDTNIDAFAKKMPDDTVVICLMAKKTIHPGQQLLSNYGGMYWAVLPFLPEPTYASSYVIHEDESVEKKIATSFSYDAQTEKLLVSLRHPMDTDIEDIPPHFRKYIHRAKITSLPVSVENALEPIEEQILQWGLPLCFLLQKQNNATKWAISLRAGQKKIKKGAPIAYISGEFCLGTHADKNKIYTKLEYKNERLFVNTDTKGNFTRLIPFAKEGNLKIEIFRKKRETSLYIIARASQDIEPGQTLFFQM